MKKSREEIQEEALQAWKDSKKNSTIACITGLGKTRIAMEAIKTFPKSSKILFLAEVKDREIELSKELKKWKVSHKVEFACYQSAYKWKGKEYDFVIYDEIHEMLTTAYSKFYYNNKVKHSIGLSATIDTKAWANEKLEITKGEMLEDICPICYTYTLSDGQLDGTSRELKIHIIRHTLDSVTKNITAGSKAKPFKQTEWANYAYWSSKIAQAMNMPESVRKLKIVAASNARAKVLYNLPSKIVACKKLVKALKLPTILFGNSLEALKKVTPNVVDGYNTDAENLAIRKNFDNGKINIIGSFKKLKQGANLNNLANCIIMSYYSKPGHIVQQVGRLRDDGTLGNVYIFLSENTQEEKWFTTMFEGVTDLKMIYYNSVEECIKKMK